MIDVFIALGANLGEREQQLLKARTLLEENDNFQLIRSSLLFETEPWGAIPQPWYLNQVCHARTTLTPPALMRWLLRVEEQLGRDRQNEERWGARPMDLDLLAYGQEEYQDELVEVPHPRLHLRRFVLEPWATIAPDWRHPRLGMTVAEMLAQVEDAGVVRRYEVGV